MRTSRVFLNVDLPRAESRADRGMEECMLNGTDEAIHILDKGGILKGEEFYYVHSAIRKMLGIDYLRMMYPIFIFEQHNYYPLPDGRIVDLDYNSQSARVTTTQYLENVRAKRSQRIKADVEKLLKESHLDLTRAAVNPDEIVVALGANPNPIHMEGGEGSDSYCGWCKSHFALPDGRTLIIGNGPDEGWSTANIW
jgi:hypothetical protein